MGVQKCSGDVTVVCFFYLREEIVMIIGVTAHEIIVSECVAEGIDYEEMYLVIRELLIKFNDGKAFAKRMGLKWINNMSKKIPYRTKFLQIVEKPWNYSKKEKKSFAWKVACEKWYGDKSYLVLEQMKDFVEGGDVLAYIIDSVYMKGKNTKKSDDSMQIELYMGRTKYFAVKKDAIVLYGLLIWKYCKRRDQEDKAKGIIDENGELIA
jgi:hypothetical protein